MGEDDHPDVIGEDRRRRPWLTAGAVVLALVVGIAVGFLVGGGTSGSGSAGTVEVAPEAAPSPTPSAPPDPATPRPCLAAGAAASEVLRELDAAVAAIGALDPTALRRILDRLQPVQRELEGAVAACGAHVGTTGPTG